MSALNGGNWLVIDEEDFRNTSSEGKDGDKQEGIVDEEQEILGNYRYIAEATPLEVKTQSTKDGADRAIFTTSLKNVHQRPRYIHLPKSHPASHSEGNIKYTQSELTDLTDLALSASSFFTDYNRPQTTWNDTFESCKTIEELKKTSPATLYIIPKEKRRTVWNFLHDYTGLLNTIEPRAILLIDATSEFFDGSVLTTLSWNKYGINIMLPENRRRMFDGESVSIHRTVSIPTKSWLIHYIQTLIPSNHDPWSFMQCLLSASLITLSPIQPTKEQEYILTQCSISLSLGKLHCPTMAKFGFRDSADLIWMAWNLLLREILYGEWEEEEAILLVHHTDIKCVGGRILCREISEDYSARLLYTDVEKLLEGRRTGPVLEIKKCIASAGGYGAFEM
jgi:hypothetical protein